MDNQVLMKATTQFKYSAVTIAFGALFIFIFPSLRDFNIEYLYIIISTILGAVSGVSNLIHDYFIIRKAQKLEDTKTEEPAKA